MKQHAKNILENLEIAKENLKKLNETSKIYAKLSDELKLIKRFKF
tara:strand:- start:4399 stop:4533 length:135 start_codon:yes stop_codon:yes gene_type:complete